MRKIFIIFWLSAFTMLFNAQQLSYISRAIGNSTHKGKGPHLQNHIVSMTVSGDGTCTTYSVWDEGGHPKGVYKDGVYLGQTSATVNSKTVKDKSNKTWTIQKYYGRFLNSPLNSFSNWRVDPVPTGTDAPYILCSDGRTITSVVDPVALGINLKTGELMVAENNIDQNIKVFDISGTPVQISTFGKQGGIFSDPIPGSTSDMLRFRGVTGLGGDDNGNIYVAMDGFPGAEGSGGGAEIRAFNPDGTLRWKMVSLLFVAAGSVDPASLDGTDIYGTYHRFKMDYSKPQGFNSDWTQAAMTINPFLYPNDPRLVISVEDAFAIKNINGNKYGFFTDMYHNMMWVYRFDGEIAVPCAGFCVAFGWNGDEIIRNSWNYTRGRPVINGDERRWLWTDKNGDGSGMYQPDEYSIYNFPDVRVMGIDVDNEGNIYLGSIDNGNVYKFPANGFDAKGNPQYSTASMEVFANVGHGAYSMKWVQENDMFLVGNGYNITTVDIWQNWSSPSRSKVRSVTLPPNRNGDARQISADQDYFYITYLMTGGPITGKQGEVNVYKISDGSFVGYIIPGPEVGNVSGWVDMSTSTHVHVTSTGKRIITVEEDEVGKILVYEWCPTGDCSQPICSSTVDSVVVSISSINMIGNDTISLSVHVYPDTVCVKNVTWSSSDTDIATVDYRGRVISKAIGSVWIKATSDMEPDKSDSTLITVTNLPVTGFDINQDSIEIPIGDEYKLTYAFIPVNALNKEVIWESNAEAIAKVDDTGKVTAVGAGVALITGKTVDANKIDTCVVTVYPITATNIKIIPSSSISMWVNDTIKFKAQIKPDNTSDKTPNWVSLDPAIATISSEGDLKAISLGLARIVVSTTDGSLHDTCMVNVVTTDKFANRDIGNPCAPGGAVIDTDSVVVTASGDDIYNNQDQFHMVYKKLTGDGQIIARIVDYFDSRPWSKIGVMMRETIDPGSKHVSMGILPGDGGSSLWYKPQTNGLASQNTLFDTAEAPYWVKLVRKGNRFTGSVAPDGKTWKTVAAVNVTMESTLFVGLCVSSTIRCTTTNAVFDNITIGTEPTSVDDIRISNADFEVFPNPLSSSSLSILLPEDAIQLSIFDVTGKMVYQEQVIKNELLINLSVFKSKGIYIVNVVTTKDTMNKKVIVIK
jgi:uncharacterized protein YjdB